MGNRTEGGPRPPTLILDGPGTGCCGARVLAIVRGTYRCPCGREQEHLAGRTIGDRLSAPKPSVFVIWEPQSNTYKTLPEGGLWCFDCRDEAEAECERFGWRHEGFEVVELGAMLRQGETTGGPS